MKPGTILILLLLLLCAPLGAEEGPVPDTIIRGGTLYDGTGGKPVRADVGIRDDRIVAVGDLRGVSGDERPPPAEPRARDRNLGGRQALMTEQFLYAAEIRTARLARQRVHRRTLSRRSDRRFAARRYRQCGTDGRG